jgi:hypothetical protein
MAGVNWELLAREVIARRVELGHHARESFAESSGIGARTLGDIETARKDSYRPATLARLEQALQWVPGSVEALLRNKPLPPLPPHLAWIDDIDLEQVRKTAAAEAEAFREIERIVKSGLPDRVKMALVRALVEEFRKPEGAAVQADQPTD